ncbi:hypothetical protein ACTMU2_08415 [Cupriavidus basilensis]
MAGPGLAALPRRSRCWPSGVLRWRGGAGASGDAQVLATVAEPFPPKVAFAPDAGQP